MSLERLPADQALAALGSYSHIIDARSEGEYAEDHLPGAVNWPSLRDEERRIVGTRYKQISQFEAQKLGAALVAKNIAEHIQREVLDKPRDWRPLVYCWRGGKRSGSLALILDQIGFRVTLVDGGYKAFRAALVADLPQLAARFSYRVVCGPTGTGKTRLLQSLARQGAQVLDLEALARHRSSVLGMIPGVAQPSQKAFDRLVWSTLNGLDPARPVYVESESKKVGNVAVPEALIEAMRISDCLRIDLPEPERVALLMEDYSFFLKDMDLFCERLGALTEARGKVTVQDWQVRARAGEVASVVQDLLVKHYDPAYRQSIARNFNRYDAAQALAPRDHSVAAMDDLAKSLLAV
ncbi:MAG: tRNA 2-selenouridine(34) synthase MnmH [Polaromonas sp.]|nr:tRNA 2-selenouridine(34) synthase MnmH [Polaromonas sp.]